MIEIRNCHSRALAAPAGEIDARLGALGSAADDLWPAGRWFAMVLDAPGAEGGRGGHGPVRYRCSERRPGRVKVTFDRLLGSARWNGFHRFVVTPTPSGSLLEHSVELTVPVCQYLQWAALVGPLHDAVLEDLLDKAAGQGVRRPLDPWVRFLRRVFPTIRGGLVVGSHAPR